MVEFGEHIDWRIIDGTEWGFDIGQRKVGFLEKMALGKKGLESFLKTSNLNMDWIFVRQPPGNHFDFKGIVIRNGMDIFQLIEDGCSRAGSDAIKGKRLVG